ncbi:MAG: sigma-54-dependent Fis family transcriptional regulator [Deltaproteobacteria bacterium]|nr:sigma-54-dependent Fis family transcriptional regulator [Deltaproteobacteria bacterium]
MPNKILLVDDEPFNLDLLEQELADRGYSIETAADGGQALSKMESFQPDLILLDYQMPDMNGVDVLREIRRRGSDVPIIMITAYGTIERAVQAMREGAYDFITKPFEPDHLALVVQKALERQNLKREVEILSEEVSEKYQLVAAVSPRMLQAVELAKKAANSKATVLLLGESGTGKELFARAMHKWSDRKSNPFITINCVGLSKELLESELFGHEKGAFTGAHELKKGKLELADGGTVFFDEIGDIASEIQTKLLRFVQEREFERVGGTKPITVEVRLIAATNRDLEKAVQEGRFREDLYHRLNVIPVTLPPLRERKEDIPALADFFLGRFSKETKKKIASISPEAKEQLLGYDWPGNVRELANVIERAVVLGQGPDITVYDLPPRIIQTEPKAISSNMAYHQAIDTYRRELIIIALNQAQGNRAAAAKALGLHRTHLMKLIKSLGID